LVELGNRYYDNGPAVLLRERLIEFRGSSLPFDVVWRLCVSHAIQDVEYRPERDRWKTAFTETRGEWEDAFFGRGTPMRLNLSILDMLEPLS
jgi:hypothetical protein